MATWCEGSVPATSGADGVGANDVREAGTPEMTVAVTAAGVVVVNVSLVRAQSAYAVSANSLDADGAGDAVRADGRDDGESAGGAAGGLGAGGPGGPSGRTT